jgi:hypothetical protein
MLFQIIFTVLGLSLIWSENTIECGHYVNGCYLPDTKTIVLNYNSDDLDRTFYHEMAHAMFADDMPRYNEEIPIMFIKYMRDDNFKYEYPDLNWLFTNKLKQYENTNNVSYLS